MGCHQFVKTSAVIYIINPSLAILGTNHPILYTIDLSCLIFPKWVSFYDPNLMIIKNNNNDKRKGINNHTKNIKIVKTIDSPLQTPRKKVRLFWGTYSIMIRFQNPRRFFLDQGTEDQKSNH